MGVSCAWLRLILDWSLGQIRLSAGRPGGGELCRMPLPHFTALSLRDVEI